MKIEDLIPMAERMAVCKKPECAEKGRCVWHPCEQILLDRVKLKPEHVAHLFETEPEHYRARLDRLETENLRLRETCDTLRVVWANAREEAASARIHAIRQAAKIALEFGAYEDQPRLASLVASDIHDLIIDMDKRK